MAFAQARASAGQIHVDPLQFTASRIKVDGLPRGTRASAHRNQSEAVHRCLEGPGTTCFVSPLGRACDN